MLFPATLHRSLSACLDFFLPAACSWCGVLLPPGRHPEDLCEHCASDIQPLTDSSCCPCCALPHATLSTIGHYCGNCLEVSPSFQKVHAVGRHSSRLKQAIHRFKYRDNPALNACLGRLLNDHLDRSLGSFRPDLVVPVPAHPTRMKQRGYNQALELARPVAAHLQVKLAPNLLQRCKQTAAQQELNARQRRENLRDAFTLQGSIGSLKILLIDDVMTTTATARECSRTLRQGGADQIQVAVLARA